MASGVNKVILVGHLGKDPEVRYTPSGQAVANFSLATSKSWNDKQGQRQDRTEWHKVVVWGKLAELCGEYLAKGRMCYVEGELQTRQWDDRDGNKRYTTEVVAKEVTFLGGRDGASAGGGGGGGSSRGEGSFSGRRNTQSDDAGMGAPSAEASFDYGPPPSDDDVPF